eukprot:11862037-Alexandrium_andersonii.AAC.1
MWRMWRRTTSLAPQRGGASGAGSSRRPKSAPALTHRDASGQTPQVVLAAIGRSWDLPAMPRPECHQSELAGRTR